MQHRCSPMTAIYAPNCRAGSVNDRMITEMPYISRTVEKRLAISLRRVKSFGEVDILSSSDIVHRESNSSDPNMPEYFCKKVFEPKTVVLVLLFPCLKACLDRGFPRGFARHHPKLV